MSVCTISTLPLELRCSKKNTSDVEQDENNEIVADGTFTTSISYHNRQQKNDLPRWRKHAQSEIIIMNDLKQSTMSYGKITQVSLRPLELKPAIGVVGQCYR